MTNTKGEENRSANNAKKDYEPHMPPVSPTVETRSKTRPEVAGILRPKVRH